MKKLLLCLMLLSSPTLADTPKQAFEGLTQCLKRDPNSCSNYFTHDSQALYQKIINYDLARCAPTNMSYISDAQNGKAQLMRIKIVENNTEYAARLAFMRENRVWKLSLPETLSRGIGAEWQSRVAATEQIFLMLKNQMHGNVGCEAISTLVGQQRNK
jgi:hypothetical protein